MFAEKSPEPSRTQAYRYALKMAWPAVLESFFVSFAGLVDSLMVSSLGSTAVASVGLTTQPKFIALSFFLATNVAISALVARRRGQKDQRGANRVFVTAFVICLGMALLICSACILYAPTFMGWAGANEDTLGLSSLYFRIIGGGLIFNILYLAINAAQRGSGNTRLAMYANVTGNLVNILGNYLLIGGHGGFPALGIRGAAIATVFGAFVSFVLASCSLFLKTSFVSLPFIWKEQVHPRLSAVRDLFHLSGGALAEQLLMRVGFLGTALMAADLGTDAFAAHNVGMNLLALSFAFGDGMQAASVALIGRSLGEQRPQLAIQYGRACQRIGLCISLCIFLTYFLGGRALYGLFFEEAHIIEYGVRILRVLSVTVMMQISGVIFIGSLRGAGDVAYTTCASTISVTLVRTLTSYLFCYQLGLGLTGLWLGIFCDQACRLTLGAIRFHSGSWTKLKI